MPAISLCDATGNAIQAASEGDLEALGRALTDRALAMPGATPQERVRALADGETIGRLLTELRRNLVADHNRLEQLRSAFAAGHTPGILNLRA